MPQIQAYDGVAIFWEEVGTGIPILFIHEFAGCHESWNPQVAHFRRSHRCITFAARGYPPSEVPEDLDAYSQQIAVDDAIAVLDAADAERAHVVGLSMGGFTALHLAIQHPQRCISATVSGVGYGAHPDAAEKFKAECELIAQAFETHGSAAVAPRYAEGPARVQFQNKAPKGWALFASGLAEHNSRGAALTMRGVQMKRPLLYSMKNDLEQLEVPFLILTGDEDDGCLEPALMMKRTIGSAGLGVIPNSGHTLNLEEPASFNRALTELFQLSESGRWPRRDPRTRTTSVTGM